MTDSLRDKLKYCFNSTPFEDLQKEYEELSAFYVDNPSMDDEQARKDIAEALREVEKCKIDLDEPPILRYADLMGAFAYAMLSIQNGVGNRERNPDEDPKAVLEELRKKINYNYAMENINKFMRLLKYEDANSRLFEAVKRFVK